MIPNNFTVGTEWKVWCDWGMSLRNNRLKFETFGKSPIILEAGIYRTYLQSIKRKPGRRQHVTWLHLESLARISTAHAQNPAPDTASVGKVETPIHYKIRELVTWECKEHGGKS
jgi:hypothetical protein